MSLTIIAFAVTLICVPLAIASSAFADDLPRPFNSALGIFAALLVGVALAGIAVSLWSYNKNVGETEQRNIEECVNEKHGSVIEISSYKACLSSDGKIIGRI